MLISENLYLFNDKPVADFEPEKGIQNIENVYRLRLNYKDYEDGKRIEGYIKQFCEDPKIAEVKELIIGHWGYSGSTSKIVTAIVEHKEKLVNLTHLMIGDITCDENEMSWIQQSNLTPAIEALPNLMYFCARGGTEIAFENLSHPTLQTLIVQTGGLEREPVKQILSAKLPKLQHLEIWTGDHNYGFIGSIEDYQPLLTEKIFPNLTYMGLRNSFLTNSFAIALKDSYLLDQLNILDFSMGTFSDKGAQALIDNPKTKNLSKLIVNHHYMSKKVATKLKLLKIIVEMEGGLGEKEPEYRYVEVSE